MTFIMKRYWEVAIMFTKREWFLLLTMGVITIIFLLFELL